MFARKKPDPSKKRTNTLSQLGLLDISNEFDPSSEISEDNANDSDLEAELAAISAGETSFKTKVKKNLVPANELDKMIADCLKDVSSDGEDDDGTENDSDLLNELQDVIGEEVNKNYKASSPTESNSAETDDKPEIFISTTEENSVDIIKKRIEMYKIAVENAESSGELPKIRRLNRGLGILNNFLKQSLSGVLINLDDIPPVVSVKQSCLKNETEVNDFKDTTKISDKTISQPEPSLSTSNMGEVTVTAEKSAKEKMPLSDNTISQQEPTTNMGEIAGKGEESAKEKIPLALPPQSNPVINLMHSRQQEYKAAALQSKRNGDTALALQYIKIVKQFDVVIKMCQDGQDVDLSDMPPPPEKFKQFMENLQAASTHQTADVAVPASSVVVEDSIASNEIDYLEALQQRLSKYKSVEESAKAEENASKARRFGRIVKQYEDAIKAYKAGRPVAYDELPVPPGFDPLPVKTSIEQKPTQANSLPLSPQPLPTVISTPQPSPNLSVKNSATQPQQDLTKYSASQQKQMKILLDRQKEFKIAAIGAKKAGEIDQAKEYLKIYKGFDAMLNATKSGLPVDISTLPVPPSQRDDLETSFAIITTEDCDPNDDISDIGVRIEEQLAKQLMMCKNTRDHHKAMGDIAGMNRFENLALTVQKDLDLVRYSKRKNFPLPKFHYEKRSFNVVHCNTDLSENELEIIIVRGINYNVPNPKEVDTYVRVEFPLLNDESFKAKTSLVKDTDSPEYEQSFKIEIMRGSRQFQRIFKRHAVKFEVYSRGGFLRSDTLIGNVNVKLQPLEVKCDIHDTFDLVEGRKKIGGKLEVKLRIRNPILTKQIEQINEKWLVIDT